MNTDWIILDTETSGLSSPIYTVELAAQRMRGWAPFGEPFRKLINQNAWISPEASRVHGYTPEILERDGFPPEAVYAAFADYAGDLPLVSYNLEYDLDKVLIPEWKRLGISPIGSRGFCALRLAQRLLDPVPAGNCKLQTLRQFYYLPERGAHTALGDVETVIDLLDTVLKPLAESRGLEEWDAIRAFVEDEWFPTCFAFGKFRGRDYRDATREPQLRSWIEGLARSSNPRTAAMGRWYIANLDGPGLFEKRANGPAGTNAGAGVTSSDMVVFGDREARLLRDKIAAARERLASLEADYTRDRMAVDVVQAALFRLVGAYHRNRDRLRDLVDYRQSLIDALLLGREDDVVQLDTGYAHRREKVEAEYDQANREAEDQRPLSDADKERLTALWKKLVRLFHPDRFAGDPVKRQKYEALIKAINHARDAGDIDTLERIASDPDGYLSGFGSDEIGIDEDNSLQHLQALYDALQSEILARLEALGDLREGGDFELARAYERDPAIVTRIAEHQISNLTDEAAVLQAKADELADQLEEITGERPS
ncbi:3'-5' exonuclease [Croceicoccus hydrothermalis]|uniref:3'-5' exonuclease n=1 Tax=Croceicoccus hydrothermalis TaxID=2867964 RepID=UPI001EFA2E34|nr:3'-5' exonuclease [Croceicoccus hydrothermalis]